MASAAILYELGGRLAFSFIFFIAASVLTYFTKGDSISKLRNVLWGYVFTLGWIFLTFFYPLPTQPSSLFNLMLVAWFLLVLCFSILATLYSIQADTGTSLGSLAANPRAIRRFFFFCISLTTYLALLTAGVSPGDITSIIVLLLVIVAGPILNREWVARSLRGLF